MSEYKLFLNSGIIADNAKDFRQPCFDKMKPPAPCKNPLTPYMFLYVLTRVSQILAVYVGLELPPRENYLFPPSKCYDRKQNLKVMA